MLGVAFKGFLGNAELSFGQGLQILLVGKHAVLQSNKLQPLVRLFWIFRKINVELSVDSQ